ncbi:MAG: molybdenum cofactor biosynthesis protein MoaD [Betaproteobacteria bacterium SG8_39]|nr:MAG: molybdenum cofactor biosynthesis protein MoaD [Betaproteobacteria bacterium SG8_39]
MKVRVLFFASLREQVGRAAEEVELPAGVATVAGLRAHLMARGGAWGAALADGRRLRAAVNQDIAAPEAALRTGDEVAFFPPVTGG